MESRNVENPQASRPWFNSVLKTRHDAQAATFEVERIGLPLNPNPPKDWEALGALDCLLRYTQRSGKILDAGAERYSKFLSWLWLYGYRDLEGCNLTFGVPTLVNGIRHCYADITSTHYDAGFFDGITCLSVVEHGVDLRLYLKEMHRILKPGGVLVTSTDYWNTPIDCRGQQIYGAPIRIFTEKDIHGVLDIADEVGFKPLGQIDLDCVEKVVHWREFDLQYTFLMFSMTKE